ncbi:MAG: hypothetical protein PHF67_03300 [Candidatus Nanoarchaeia archaeon]|nr:hypothetical protein [Candidatus Nanoarchaeia archaeon]
MKKRGWIVGAFLYLIFILVFVSANNIQYSDVNVRVISRENYTNIVTEKSGLDISNIENIIAKNGEKKTLALNVKNTGQVLLKDCRLQIIGEINSWFYSDQVGTISPGENRDFIFYLNIPEGAEKKDYYVKMELKCEETGKSSNFTLSILKNPVVIGINEVVIEKNNLRIKYIINSETEIFIDIWLVDSDGNEIKRIRDNGIGERNIVMELEPDLTGIYSVYFAESLDLSNSVKQSVVLGKSSLTGFIIIDQPGNKLIGYIVFVSIICGGVFFIVRSKNVKIPKSKQRVLHNKKRF